MPRAAPAFFSGPVALPLRSTVTSRTIASDTMSQLPVASAGGSRTVVDWKLALIEQPRPHSVAQKHACRLSIDAVSTRRASALSGCSFAASRLASWRTVSTARCAGITGMPSGRQAFWVRSSDARAAGGGSSTPGDELGVFSSPSFDP